MDKLIEISKNIRNKKYRGNDPFGGFFSKIWLSRNIVATLYKFRDNYEVTPDILQESFKNCIINLITALEVYLNDWAIHLIDDQKFEYKKALKKARIPSFSLDEVEYLLEQSKEKSELTIGNIFVRYCNFQNIEKFHKIFSLIIFGEKGMIQPLHFHLEFEGGEQKMDKFTNSDFEKLKKIISLRHKYIHDFTFKHELEIEDVLSYFILVERFGYSVFYLMLKLFSEKGKYKIIQTDNNRFHYEKIAK